MGTHWFTSVKEALKFFGSNVRGILLGGSGLGVEVGPVAAVGPVAPVGGTAVEVSPFGVAVTSAPVHPEARAHRHAPTIDMTTNRFPSMAGHASCGNMTGT
jgi:hypothetical protein